MNFDNQLFRKYMKRVVEWNAVFNDITDQSPERLELQKAITMEEIKETEFALDRNDHKEILDGVADTFVTATFLHYLKFQGYPEEVDIRYGELRPKAIINSLIDDIDYSNYHFLARDVFDLCDWCYSRYGADADKYFNRVFDSNDSKFVPAAQFDEEFELTTAKAVYEPKGFKDIVAVEVPYKGDTVFVIRADGGSGKLLKPTTFEEP